MMRATCGLLILMNSLALPFSVWGAGQCSTPWQTLLFKRCLGVGFCTSTACVGAHHPDCDGFGTDARHDRTNPQDRVATGFDCTIGAEADRCHACSGDMICAVVTHYQGVFFGQCILPCGSHTEVVGPNQCMPG